MTSDSPLKLKKLKLFVSHSSKTDAHRQLLKDVCHALSVNGAGFHVLVDQNGEIPIGEEWFMYLAEWMAECDAAIILFTNEAFHDSQWVRAEAAILSWRKRIQPEFKLFAVLLDDIDPKQYAEDEFYQVIRFADFQHVRDCRSDNKEQIIDKITNALGEAQTEQTPFQGLIVKISDVLTTISPDVLERIYKQLDTQCKPIWHVNLNYGDALARMMLRDPKNALSQLYVILSELAHIPNFNSGIENLLEMLKGMWVHPEAAATLTCCHRDQRKPYLINARDVQDFTGPCYLRRAWAYPHDFKIIPAGTSRTEAEIDDVLMGAFEGVNPRRAKHKLKNYSHPLVLLFTPPEDTTLYDDTYPDKDLLFKVQEKHPHLTVLIATGENIPPALTTFAITIEPQLAVGEEEKQYDAFDEVKALIH